ncbi:MAG: tryptophan-rich sensory protein [Candidatus Pacebacteria bacterium]|nr:tryptophan-rich sensory protein [Candidatus Paceibacterota bacterium]
MRNIFKLAVSIGAPLLAGGIGSLFTASSLDVWYMSLLKPSLNPPGWVFGPVWTTLFVLMGSAAFLIWKKAEKNRQARTALIIFGIQLILNVFWSILFFGLQSPGGAFIEIIFLWVSILCTIIAFAKISKLAAWLLVPYIIWVSFAGYLNYWIYALN